MIEFVISNRVCIDCRWALQLQHKVKYVHFDPLSKMFLDSQDIDMQESEAESH